MGIGNCYNDFIRRKGGIMTQKDYSHLFDDWRKLGPEEFIEQLFIKTDDGILNLAQWHGIDRDHAVPGVERYHMSWTVVDKDRIIRRFHILCDALQKIAPYFDLEAMAAPEAIKDTHLLEIWDMYLQPLDGGDMDMKKIKDIADRVSTQCQVQDVAASLSQGKALDAYEKDLLMEYMDIAVSAEERAYLEQYEENQRKDAQRRIGGKCWASLLIEQARWTCRTMRCDLHRKLPEHIIRTQLVRLAYYMTINAACESMETLQNTWQLWDQMLAMELDEDYDEVIEAPESVKKTNSVKSLVPIFVVKILKQKTDSMHHMRQTELLEELKEYEVCVERKALNRAVHTLVDSSLPIEQDKTGVWYVQ